MKFQVIVCDPPYGFSDRLTMSNVKRSAQANYATLTNEQIKQLPIKEVSDSSGAILALWVPSSLLPFGLELMENWGFKLKQTYIWNKIKKEPLANLKKNLIKTIKNMSGTSAMTILSKIFDATKEVLNSSLGFGMGRLFRNTHEICLIGINNNKIYPKLQNKSQRSVCFAPNLKHSAKPENLQDSLDIMFPEPSIKRIEIFARRQRPDWVCIGNEAPETFGEDIEVSLNKLINQ